MSVLGLTRDDRRRLGVLKDVPSNMILLGILLFYPRDRVFERGLVEFFQALAREVPVPFSEPRLQDVPRVMAELQGGAIRADIERGAVVWRTCRDYVAQRERELTKLGFFPMFEPPLRFLAERFRMYAERPSARVSAP